MGEKPRGIRDTLRLEISEPGDTQSGGSLEESIDDLTLQTLQSVFSDFDAESLLSYFPRYDIAEALCLWRAGISRKEAETWPEGLHGYQISCLHYLGITPGHLTYNEQEDLLKAMFEDPRLGEIWERPDEHAFLGSGKHAFVVLDDTGKTAYKIGRNLENEYGVLKKMRAQERKRGRRFQHMARMKKGLGRGQVDVIELEYIQGRTLEQVLRDSSLSPRRTLRYTQGIFYGLMEMRESGILYHRDVRPANVIVDNKKAILIDFGIATEEPQALIRDNRRYGGSNDVAEIHRANDLFSLGQVSYVMATGSHLFSESGDARSITAGDLVIRRREAFEDPKKRRRYREKVYDTVPDALLAAFTWQLMTSRPDDYGPVGDELARLTALPIYEIIT
ncbi:hypothetical protein COV20_06265 [Candidatus Woesearchaeota archaeon CG10_big_fil_rev_8_21_14_0_10_45_16]|nr:MAG: hypothetical protein COV20_06265 [Candidatus Woesearchaeota archaeon CG10_big_fil_rev_8_21_14_0_10_45_16]